MPTYETIPLHPMDGATLQLLEQSNGGYDVLSRKKKTSIPGTGVVQEIIYKDDSEERYSQLELRAKSNGMIKMQEGDYSKLETITVDIDSTNDTTINDTICEEATNDIIFEEATNDIICEGATNDIICKGATNDISEEATNEIISEGATNDIICEGATNDISEEATNEIISEGATNDIISEGTTNDIICEEATNEWNRENNKAVDKDDGAQKMERGDSESEKEKREGQETLLMVTTAPATRYIRYIHLLSSLRVYVCVY